MSESPPSPSPPAPVIDSVEWLPAGAGSGLLRVCGRWPERPGAPILVAGEHRFEPLAEPRDRAGRATYLLPAGVLEQHRDDAWLEWPGAGRIRLPPPSAAPAESTAGITPAERPPARATGGGVVDQHVLAERRARRGGPPAPFDAPPDAAAWASHRAELEAELARIAAELAAAREEAAGAQRAREEATREARVAAERAEARAAAAGTRLQEAIAAASAAEARLRAEGIARVALEEALDRERAAAATLAEALAAERATRETAGFALAAAQADLRAARAARAADAEAIATLSGDLEAERTAHRALHSITGDLRTALAAAREEAQAERTRAEAATATSRSQRAAAESERDAARTELEAARGERDAALARLARTDAAPPPPLAGRQRDGAGDAEPHVAAGGQEAGGEGIGVMERIAVLDRPAAPGELERRAAELARVAAGPAPQVAEAGRVVADLDAAAAALRTAPPPDKPGPRLRSVLVGFARDDPRAAGRLLAQLLPAQGAVIPGPLEYDLTIRDVGTFAVSIGRGVARARLVGAPRPRREAAFHLSTDPLTLAELLDGADRKIGRWSGPARLRGRRRRLKPLEALPTATLGLAEAARAGARLEPELVYRMLARAVDPAWTRGHVFTVAQRIAGEPPQTWYLIARDGAGLAVAGEPTAGEPDATVTLTPAAFEALLRADPPPAGERPSIRGDRAAVALLTAWVNRARGGGAISAQGGAADGRRAGPGAVS